MSKIDKLKLRKIEEASDNELKMASMSYGNWDGSSGSSGAWVSGGGTSEEDCMSQDMYWELTEQGTSVSNVYVCGIGYVSGTSEVWGSGGSGSNGGSYGCSGSGSKSSSGSSAAPPCKSDECSSNRDCWDSPSASGTGFCISQNCGFLGWDSYKKCDPASDSERACIGVEPKKECKIVNPATGQYKYGYCSQSANSRGARYCWFGGNIAVP